MAFNLSALPFRFGRRITVEVDRAASVSSSLTARSTVAAAS
jgi:hypothetical protein